MSLILTVDDDNDINYLLRTLLESSGHRVMSAEHGVEALQLARNNPPDLIISDILMPVMDGFQLCREWKADPCLAPIPFLFHTATYASSKDQRFALSLGADGFLIKPMEPNALLAEITQFLGRTSPAQGTRPKTDEAVVLKEYNAVLIHKLEEKVEQLKSTSIQAMQDHERLQLALEAANAGIWDYDISSGHIHWNDTHAALFGMQLEQFDGRIETVRNCIHPHDIENLRRSVESAKNQQQPFSGEFRVRWPDGSIHWMAGRGRFQYASSGAATRMSGVVIDISDRKIAEDRLRKTERSLQEREHQLEQAQQLAELGWWHFDGTTKAFQCSREHLNFLGLTADTHGNLPYDTFLSLVHPDDRGIAEFPSTCNREKNIRQIQYRIQRRDGKERVIREVAELIASSTGHVISACGTSKDITQSKMLEAALTKAKNDAEKANRAKSEFLSSMSHELRTPMNAILEFAQLLLDDATLTDDNKENVDEILKAGNHLLTLINEVLDLARIEAGRLQLSLERVNLEETIEDCIRLSRSLADKANIKLDYIGTSGCDVMADRVRLKQVILNLISNAVKYNRAGGSVAIATRACTADDEFIEISVVDTGKGMNEQMLQRLFLPFNRLGAEDTKIEGTGIGLSITRQLVGLMQGSIQVRSTLGAGSCFTIRLPCAQHSPSLNPAPTKQLWRREANSSERALLYIEDNPVNLKLVEGIIKRIPGLSLISAHTPELGLELTLSHKPDLILCDINLPGLDGYEILEILKSAHETSTIPVIAVTASASPEDIERGKQAGFDAYLTKPLDISTFTDTIQRFLKRTLS